MAYNLNEPRVIRSISIEDSHGTTWNINSGISDEVRDVLVEVIDYRGSIMVVARDDNIRFERGDGSLIGEIAGPVNITQPENGGNDETN